MSFTKSNFNPQLWAGVGVDISMTPVSRVPTVPAESLWQHFSKWRRTPE